MADSRGVDYGWFNWRGRRHEVQDALAAVALHELVAAVGDREHVATAVALVAVQELRDRL